MTSREIAVWCEQGEAPRRGVVVKRGSAKAAVVVDWDEGRQERVPPDDRAVKYAREGSQRLEWLLKPGLLEAQFKMDPVGVIVDVIRDEGKGIQSPQIRKRLEDLGLPAAKVAAAFTRAKASLQKNRHIVIERAKHTWSDVPVDPFAKVRAMHPQDALDRLLATPRLKVEEKEALADAIRAALPARG